MIEHCIPILSKELQQSTQRNNCQSVLNCLKKWENLLREDQARANVGKELDQATKVVTAQLAAYDQQFQRDMKELQKPIQQIINFKSVTTKLQKIMAICSELLDITPSYEELIKVQQQLQNRLDACERDALKNIKVALETALKDPQS